MKKRSKRLKRLETKRGIKLIIFNHIKKNPGKYVFFFLVILNLVLITLILGKAKGVFIPESSFLEPSEIKKESSSVDVLQPKLKNSIGSINFNRLSLQQKIAQMTIVLGVEYYSDALKKMQLGGVHIHTLANESVFRRVIKTFQENTTIPFMITADLEGCINPFANFKTFEPASKITTIGDAFEKGKLEGKYLKELGFTVNFAPVVDLNDSIWTCRSFKGSKEEISELANAYILGLQDEGILATAKHYPGKTLIIKDPHKYLAAAEITKEDLYPYEQLINKNNAKAIMVSHLITYGEVNSEGKPSVTSKKIIDGLRSTGFDGLIITDEINMKGVSKFYESRSDMYIDVFKAGADIVLNFYQDPNEIYDMIKTIEKSVKNGTISEDRIDTSVKRILTAKGIEIK